MTDIPGRPFYFHSISPRILLSVSIPETTRLPTVSNPQQDYPRASYHCRSQSVKHSHQLQSSPLISTSNRNHDEEDRDYHRIHLHLHHYHHLHYFCLKNHSSQPPPPTATSKLRPGYTVRARRLGSHVPDPAGLVQHLRHPGRPPQVVSARGGQRPPTQPLCARNPLVGRPTFSSFLPLRFCVCTVLQTAICLDPP